MPEISLTEEEVAELRLEFFPRMLVASVVSGNDVAARAVFKICPNALPHYKRHELERASTLQRGGC